MRERRTNVNARGNDDKENTGDDNNDDDKVKKKSVGFAVALWQQDDKHEYKATQQQQGKPVWRYER